MEFHHIMMLIHHKIDDPINYSIAMFHCELVCFLPGKWPSHACRLRGNHWAGSPKPSKNRKISSGVRQVKKTFSMSFSANSGSLSISNNLALNAEDDFELCLVTWTWLLTSPWSIWEHQGSCSSYLPAAGPDLKPGEPEHCEFLMENLCISYSPHPCLLHCIKTSTDIFHGEIETGLQSQKILH